MDTRIWGSHKLVHAVRSHSTQTRTWKQTHTFTSFIYIRSWFSGFAAGKYTRAHTCKYVQGAHGRVCCLKGCDWSSLALQIDLAWPLFTSGAARWLRMQSAVCEDGSLMEFMPHVLIGRPFYSSGKKHLCWPIWAIEISALNNFTRFHTCRIKSRCRAAFYIVSFHSHERIF